MIRWTSALVTFERPNKEIILLDLNKNKSTCIMVILLLVCKWAANQRHKNRKKTNTVYTSWEIWGQIGLI